MSAKSQVVIILLFVVISLSVCQTRCSLCSSAPGTTFNGLTVYLLPAGIGNARCQIFQRQIRQNGGQTESSLSPSVTHVVADDNMDIGRALRLLRVDSMPSGVQLVKCTWLSLCISEKQLLDVTNYSLLLPKRFANMFVER